MNISIHYINEFDQSFIDTHELGKNYKVLDYLESL